jgi:hypothetical protein
MRGARAVSGETLVAGTSARRRLHAQMAKSSWKGHSELCHSCGGKNRRRCPTGDRPTEACYGIGIRYKLRWVVALTKA